MPEPKLNASAFAGMNGDFFMKNKRIGFIGVGNMAGAIIGGLTALSDGAFSVQDCIALYDANPEQYTRLKGNFKIAENIEQLVANSDIVVLAVKPQNYSEVLSEIRGLSLDGKLFVSIAAGISTQYIEKQIGAPVPVVRTMPNTPLLIGRGVTALCRNERVSDAAFDDVEEIFLARGETLRLEEKDMNKIIAATSSAPAYVFLMIKAICEGAKAQELACTGLKEAVCKMVAGSAELALQSEKSLDDLIRMVTSPKGTTEKALDVFYKYNLENIVSEAMLACTNRADELSMN